MSHDLALTTLSTVQLPYILGGNEYRSVVTQQYYEYFVKYQLTADQRMYAGRTFWQEHSQSQGLQQLIYISNFKLLPMFSKTQECVADVDSVINSTKEDKNHDLTLKQSFPERSFSGNLAGIDTAVNAQAISLFEGGRAPESNSGHINLPERTYNTVTPGIKIRCCHCILSVYVCDNYKPYYDKYDRVNNSNQFTVLDDTIQQQFTNQVTNIFLVNGVQQNFCYRTGTLMCYCDYYYDGQSFNTVVHYVNQKCQGDQLWYEGQCYGYNVLNDNKTCTFQANISCQITTEQLEPK